MTTSVLEKRKNVVRIETTLDIARHKWSIAVIRNGVLIRIECAGSRAQAANARNHIIDFECDKNGADEVTATAIPKHPEGA